MLPHAKSPGRRDIYIEFLAFFASWREKMFKPGFTITFFFLIPILSTGCTTIVKPEQPAVLDAAILDEDHSVGQSFSARFDGMNEVEIYLELMKSGDGEIQLTLQTAPQGEILGRVSLPIEEISSSGFNRFPLPVQLDSNLENYYISLKVKGPGRVKVGTAPGDSYLNGALYQNNVPDDQHQLRFQLGYYAPRVVLGLVGEVFTWIGYLLVAAFLFVPPGWALLTFLWARLPHAELLPAYG